MNLWTKWVIDMQFLDDPFPHVLSIDHYDEKELFLIEQELKFLTYPNKLLPSGIHHGSPQLTGSKALHLERAYVIPEISDILRITKKNQEDSFVSTIASKWPHLLKIKFIDHVITKVRYYHNNEGYAPHTDIAQDFLAFSFFHKTPKKFTGGELYFPDYNYEIECAHNTFILFPGYVQHEVKKVVIDDTHYWSGNGRYCVSQFLSLNAKV